MTELRASAVVYGEKDVAAPVNRAWLDAALDFLSGHGLPVREYQAKLTPTSAAAASMAQRPGPLIPRGGRRAGPRTRIRRASGGEAGSRDVVARRCLRQPEQQLCFPRPPRLLGRPPSRASAGRRPARLDHCAFRYGISYLLPIYNGPVWYAVGIGSHRSTDPRTRQSRETMSQLSKWQVQLVTKQKYLGGWFRDVYPANLLSEEHLRAALPGGKTLETLGIGRLSLLGPGKWLWEVSDDESHKRGPSCAKRGC